jgi:trk system potassium uptake protein TrkH
LTSGLPRITFALGAIGKVFSVALLLPIPIAFAYEPWDTTLGPFHLPRTAIPFAASFLLATGAWVAARAIGRKHAHEELTERSAYLTVAVGWLGVAALAMLPFLFSGTFSSTTDALANAFFESMSGLTGTGATVIDHPEALPAGLLFWRALTQWLGGLGIIILTVALLSRLTHGGLQLFQSEVVAPGRLRPKVAEVARGMWRIYLAITLVFIGLLWLVFTTRQGMAPKPALLESALETFSAYGNGAFASHAGSFVPQDGAVAALLSLMMLAGATNFTLVFLLARRLQWKPLVRNPEWRFYLLWLAAAAALVGLLRWGSGTPPVAAFSQGGFAVVSLGTGTGFAAGDYAYWSAGLHALFPILLLLTLVGGCAGSAAGGVKGFRALVLGRTVARELRRILHPRAIIPVRVGRVAIPEDSVSAVVAFFFTYLTIWVIGAIGLALLEPNLGSDYATGGSLAALGNVGTNFGQLASLGYQALSWPAKLLLSALMWIGRMEIFAALLVFMPRAWRH